MTSLASCSSRSVAALAAALLLGACAHRAGAPDSLRARLALFPPENLTGGPAALQSFAASLERALAGAGIEVVLGDAVNQYLARHRIRYTAGIDGPSARAAKEELGVDGLLVTWVEQYETGNPPKLAVTMRVVSAEERPRITWMGAAAAAGDDAPGLLGLGLIESMSKLETKALEGLAGSLASLLDGKGTRSATCRPGLGLGWFHRSLDLDTARRVSVIVLPFVNRTSRRGAGEIVAMGLARQLAAAPSLDVVELGIVRDELLNFRLVMPEGPSLDDVLALNASLRADLVVSGQVLEYYEGLTGAPKIGFAVTVLDGRTRKVVWRSSSHAKGDDRVVFFGLNRISTASELACHMARSVVDRLLEPPGSPAPITTEVSP